MRTLVSLYALVGLARVSLLNVHIRGLTKKAFYSKPTDYKETALQYLKQCITTQGGMMIS